jgi:hypothetical protein
VPGQIKQRRMRELIYFFCLPQALEKKINMSPALTNNALSIHPYNLAFVVAGKIKSLVFYPKTHFQSIVGLKTLIKIS